MILWWLMVSKHCLCCTSWGIGLSNRIIQNQHPHEEKLPAKCNWAKNVSTERCCWIFNFREKNGNFLGKQVPSIRSCISQIFGTVWSVARDSTGKLLLIRESACSASRVQCRSPFNPNLHGLNSAWLIFSCIKVVTAFRIFLPLNYEGYSVGVSYFIIFPSISLAMECSNLATFPVARTES